MAEYIEKEPLLKKAKELQGGSFSTPLIVAAIETAPTTDVVPKSEVEYWKEQYFHACMSNGCVDEKVIEYLRTNAEGHNDPVGEDGVDGLESVITQAKAEVAREIF